MSRNLVGLATLAALAAGGAPSAPPRTMVLRERDLWTGSDTERRYQEARERRRERKRAQKAHEVELAGLNLKRVLQAEKENGLEGKGRKRVEPRFEAPPAEARREILAAQVHHHVKTGQATRDARKGAA